MSKWCAILTVSFLFVASSLSQGQADSKKADAKELEGLVAKYKYPESKKTATRSWGINKGVLLHYQGVFLTPDGPAQVRDWYTKNLLKLKESVGQDKITVLEDGLTIIQHDWSAQDDSDRPTSVTAIFHNGKEYTWSVVISRSEKEKTTHIAVSVKRTKKD